jgi:hypothetical protein
VNDSSWRSLSAILGAACVVLIIAAGALLATSGEASPTPSGPASSIAIGSPTGSGPSDSVGPSSSASSSTPAPTPTPSVTPQPANAPITSITFNNVLLDASTDPLGKARTFTFITDGNGAVGISIVKSSPAKTTTRICAKVDDGKADCRTGTKVTYKGAFTDTAHSVWVVTMIGNSSAKPTVDLTLSWPSNSPKITLGHFRLQGSATPGVSEFLNGFTATFAPKRAGSLGVSASWTTITTDVRVSTAQVIGSSANLVDSKSYTAAQNLGTPGYSFDVTAGKIFKVTLRDLSADAQRPDLSAVISLP